MVANELGIQKSNSKPRFLLSSEWQWDCCDRSAVIPKGNSKAITQPEESLYVICNKTKEQIPPSSEW